MMKLDENDRALLVSMYIDRELDAEQEQAVRSKIRADPAWKAEYDSLLISEERISKVVENNWHDADLTEKIMTSVKALPRPSSATAVAAERNAFASQRTLEARHDRADAWSRRARNRGWLAAAAALVLVGLTLIFALKTTPPKPVETAAPAIVGRFRPKGLKLCEGAKSNPCAEDPVRHGLSVGVTATALDEPTLIELLDGSRIWLRQGTTLKAIEVHVFELFNGVLFAEVEPTRKSGFGPFTVVLPDQSKALALGTRFEVGAAGKDVRVRVVEGVVQRQGAGRKVSARGGQLIAPDYALRHLDPRSVSMDWANRAQVGAEASAAVGLLPSTAPWPQLGGSPSHAGLTPVVGPTGQPVAGRFELFPPPEDAANRPLTQYLPAVVGTESRVFVLRPTADKAAQLLMLNLSQPASQWTFCGEPLSGIPHNAPVLTPKGLVVFGTSNRKVRAWDPEKAEVAWTRDFEHSVWAVCAAHNGTLLCSTFSGLVALDETGQRLWDDRALGDIQAPATVMPDGRIVVVSGTGKGRILSEEGKELKTFAWSSQVGIRWPAVIQDDADILLTSSDGSLQQFGAEQTDPGGQSIASSGIHFLPLGTGAHAKANVLFFRDGSMHALKTEGQISALAQDGQGILFAAIDDTLFRIDTKSTNAPAKPILNPVKRGRVVRGGIAILPGKLVVTTSEGIQLME